MSKKNVLGRGVDALLSGGLLDTEEEGKFFFLDIDKIAPNPNQPRKYFDEQRLQELAESIKERGIIQPLLVTKVQGNRYHLIAGERRLRAARLAGNEEVPVMVMEDKGADESLELALVENLQRHDLNPIEEAIAYSHLVEDFDLTQEDVARKVGRNRSTVANALRLLQLPPEIQEDTATGRVSEGHARVLLRLRDDLEKMNELRDLIVKEQLSVRETEKICTRLLALGKKNKAPVKPVNALSDSYCKTVTGQLTARLNAKIRIVQKGDKGKLEISYSSGDEFKKIIETLSGTPE